MSFSKSIREIVVKKYDNRCAYCGCSISISDMQIDHIIPKDNFQDYVFRRKVPLFLNHLSKEDVNHIHNLNPACRVCNRAKDKFDLEAFRRHLSEQVNRLNNYSSNFRLAKKYNQIKETIKPIQFHFENWL